MKKHEYSIEKMDKIISAYKAAENIDCITEEEFTNLFGESTLFPNCYFTLFPNYYFIGSEKDYNFFSITDYDYYQIMNGFNPITGQFAYVEPMQDEIIMDEMDVAEPQDIYEDPIMHQYYKTFKGALEEAVLMDRFHYILNNNIKNLKNEE